MKEREREKNGEMDRKKWMGLKWDYGT